MWTWSSRSGQRSTRTNGAEPAGTGRVRKILREERASPGTSSARSSSALLRSHFFVVEGSKCVTVRSSLIRLPADVLICLDHRYYQSFPSFAGQIFTEGVQFYASGDRKIVNYPKRHISACARKDNWTDGAYRRVVRIAKNARNKLISEDGTEVGTGTAPSYFLESCCGMFRTDVIAAPPSTRTAKSWHGCTMIPARSGVWTSPTGWGNYSVARPIHPGANVSARTIISALYSQLDS